MSKVTELPSALAQWSARGYREATLPSLARVKVVIPSPEAILQNGNLPQDLRLVALRYAVSSISLENATAETLEGLLSLTQMMAATALREVWDELAGEWAPLSLSAAELADAGLPAEDLTALEAIALRRQTPEQVTAASYKDRGLKVPGEIEDAAREGASATSGAYAAFRGESGRVTGGADSIEVRPKSRARLPRDQRSVPSAAS